METCEIDSGREKTLNNDISDLPFGPDTRLSMTEFGSLEEDSWITNRLVARLDDRVRRKAAFARRMTIWLLCRRGAGGG